MGVATSIIGKGSQSEQVAKLLSGSLYDQFIRSKHINDSDEFHIAILEIFNSLNSALPGKHYDAPSSELIKECFTKWEKARDRKEFIDFMMKNVKQNKSDSAMIITGVVTPPGAMVVKRAGEGVGQLSMLKSIPDVVFVPSATMLVLVAVKFSKRMFAGVQ